MSTNVIPFNIFDIENEAVCLNECIQIIYYMREELDNYIKRVDKFRKAGSGDEAARLTCLIGRIYNDLINIRENLYKITDLY